MRRLSKYSISDKLFLNLIKQIYGTEEFWDESQIIDIRYNAEDGRVDLFITNKKAELLQEGQIPLTIHLN